ncbi:hypothetical protein [Phaeocystidibacter luteus]|uniref:Outer membrane beta-barrel protein n=1 Tax=Phaeocystidibacter luteus TaxID=911197 RepID=A0A6N6RDS4_9FLAO|nr:hypothetical protein [Phaeocystidibacter luteus]KAB2807380.1 hypothetical protein F8C67_12450 [Phaeocystidibacter luteus]
MRKLFATVGLLASFGVFGQNDTDADWKRTVYSEEFTIGVVLHTGSPWPGFNFRRLHWTDGFTKWGYEIDYTAYRHPREIKYPAQSILGSSRSFTYGKINDFFAFRTGYGRERVLYDKQDRGTLSISLQTYGGVAWGMLKPVYVDVVRFTPDGNRIEGSERYDPEIHDNAMISGQEPFFTGFSELQIRPGVYTKIGLSFDYNFLDEKITAMEVGTIFDYYPNWFGLYESNGVPVMARVDNPSLWWQIYISFNFGNKWY